MWNLSLIFFFSNLIPLLFASPTSNHSCRPDQRDALWEFKSEFDIDSYLYPNVDSSFYARTEKWRNNTDCCSWDGVSCDPKTGIVVELNLGRSYLNGPLRSNSSLFRLHHLESLVLTFNNFWGILPDSISNLKYLKVLDLSACSLFGKIPSSLGNLSYLTHLQLDYNGLTGELPESLGNLNRLTTLDLYRNNLGGSFPHTLLNLSSLTRMDIGSNRFQGTLPSNMSRLSKLETFVIVENSFSGTIPSSLFMIPSLINLYLTENHFSGSLETWNISSLSRLKILWVGKNDFSGPIPSSIWKLVGLESLDLAYLNTSTVVDLSLLSHHTSLEYLDLSGISLKIGSTLYIPSSIQHLVLSSCDIVQFPKFLQNKTKLESIDISANQIGGKVPEWLWSLPNLWSVNISHNSFAGFEGPADVIKRRGIRLLELDISSNTFHDPFPLLPNSTLYIFASDNRFSGEIPTTICKLVVLRTLDLSNNGFNGSIPRCFENFNTTLYVLHLRNNNLSGTFPEESISPALNSFDVGHNHLSGRLPKSLADCTDLEFLNVGNNRFNDTFPSWLPLLPYLQVLVLRSNEFHGPITDPGAQLRFFDISENHFNGVLPSDYFAGWSTLSTVVDIANSETHLRKDQYHKVVALVNKGLNMELVGSGFAIYKVIDVSGNRFKGDIPESIGLLKALIVLNMSNNAFAGRIPQSLSNLTNVQSLDLSLNRLSGRIPPELGKLTFLSRMNFSHNKLEGPIPQRAQFQSQDSSSFAGNLGLCGVPLQETCGGKEAAAAKQEEEEEEETVSWIAAAIAYVPGVFCGLIIAHILASSYRHKWFVMKIFPSST